jgi:hypothetical protein
VPTVTIDAVGTTVYAYTAAGQLFTEDGPFSSDTVTNYYWFGNGHSWPAAVDRLGHNHRVLPGCDRDWRHRPHAVTYMERDVRKVRNWLVGSGAALIAVAASLAAAWFF